MKNLPEIKLKLQIEDYIALVFVLIVASMYAWASMIHVSVERGMAVTFYYFLFPCVLILFKEAFSYFLSENASSRAFISVIRDWFPFLLILSMYYSFYDGLNQFITQKDCDNLLASWDMLLFGGHLSVWLERFTVYPWLMEWMSFSYLSFVFLPPAVTLYYYFSGQRIPFRTVMISFVIMECIGCLGYAVFPAVGPRFAFQNWYSVSLMGGKVTELTGNFINFTRLPRDCFPSLHCGLTSIFYFSLLRNSFKTGLLITPLVVSLYISCIFLRYHYLVDVLAGILIAAFIHYCAVRYIEPSVIKSEGF